MTTRPDAVVLTAPDGCTKYLRSAVEHSIDQLDPGDVLEIPGETLHLVDLAEWCLRSGHRVANPFDHWALGPLLIAKAPIEQAAARTAARSGQTV